MPRDGDWVGRAVELRDWSEEEQISKIAVMVWNPNTLQWERMTQPSASVLTPLTPAVVSVLDTSTSVVVENLNRRGLVLINTSSNRISLAFGAVAVIDKGVTLYPQGVYEMDEWLFTRAAVNAIASAGGGSNLSVQEYN